MVLYNDSSLADQDCEPRGQKIAHAATQSKTDGKAAPALIPLQRLVMRMTGADTVGLAQIQLPLGRDDSRRLGLSSLARRSIV